ncbi:hypothetical protein RN001_000382 [Aquatica leii]|uniref:Uncharacterized protein n=1 Tax=Aquatica leii TaxID=1421715 RepID=A0AAN7PK19_9COLE|nr:hypothetical protein RN001_000382 [Aquatica leii]
MATSIAVEMPKFMNTYRLESNKPFQVERVEKILKEVLTEALDNLAYDVEKCPNQAKWASGVIRDRIKAEEYDRYKLVIMVTIGEKRYQDMCCVVRFLWDIERDKYALCVQDNLSVFAAALCFGVYYE